MDIDRPLGSYIACLFYQVFWWNMSIRRAQEMLESIVQRVCLHYAVIGWPTMNFSIDFESLNFTLILAFKNALFFFQKSENTAH